MLASKTASLRIATGMSAALFLPSTMMLLGSLPGLMSMPFKRSRADD